MLKTVSFLFVSFGLFQTLFDHEQNKLFLTRVEICFLIVKMKWNLHSVE